MRRAWGVLAVALLTSGCDSCSRTDAPAPDGGDAARAPVLADASPINVTPLPAASIAALVNPQHLPAYTGPTGSVEGTITVSGPAAPEAHEDFKRCPDAARMSGRAFREGEPKTPEGPRWLADAVVAVTGYGDFYIPEQDEAEPLAIEGCSFAKRTITMTFGQRLEVKNLTKEFWTPKLQPAQTGVMMMAAPGSDAVKLYPKKPGRYLLVDHDRKYATADLYAFLHPLHTSTTTLGTYRIDGVPVGKVKVNTMHPRVPGDEVTREVEIHAGVVLKVDLNLVHKPAPIVDAGASDAAYHPPLR